MQKRRAASAKQLPLIQNMTAPEAIGAKTLIKLVDMTKATKAAHESLFWERIPLDGAEKTVQRPQERDREAIMASLEQLKLAVSDFPPFVESCLRNFLRYRCDTFTAGCIAHSLPAWPTITSDNEILSTVMGLKIDFDTKPHQQFLPNCRRSATETTIIDAEIKKLS